MLGRYIPCRTRAAIATRGTDDKRKCRISRREARASGPWGLPGGFAHRWVPWCAPRRRARARLDPPAVWRSLRVWASACSAWRASSSSASRRRRWAIQTPRRSCRRGAPAVISSRRSFLDTFLDRQFELGQPPPALVAEQITDLRAALQEAHQDRVDLVVRTCARRHQLIATRQAAAHHPRALIGHPQAVQ